MKTQLFPAKERGTKNIGWLKSNFFFSFSDYFHPLKSAFGTIVAFNDDYVEPGRGFGLHPHMNMEIISIMLRGKMNHKDSMGYVNTVQENEVQIMSAGSGLKHEEYNIGEDEVNFLQIWIQPKLQNIIPRYQFRNFPKDQRINQLKTIVSHEEGFDHCWINQNTKLLMGYYLSPQKMSYSISPVNKCIFVFNIEGSMKIGDQPVYARDAIGIWDTEDIMIEVNGQSEFLIIETPVNQK